MQNNPNLKHYANQEYIKELNKGRDAFNVPKLIAKSITAVNNILFFNFDERNFIFIYDLESNKFFDSEQKYLGTNINESINAFSISKILNIDQDIVSVSYNRFNEFKLKMSACVGITTLSTLTQGINPLEIEISNEAPITKLLLSKNVLFASFFDEKIQAGKFRIYALN